MISLTLISVVLIFMFNILSDLKVEDRDATRGSQDAVERASYTRIIQNDFISHQLKEIRLCSPFPSGAEFCYMFFYKDGTIKNLEIYNKKDDNNSTYVVYDDEKWDIDSTTFNKSKATLCYSESGDYHVLKMNLPTNTSPNAIRKLDLELTYAADYKLTIASSLIKC